MNRPMGPLKRMLSAICGLVQTRLELISIELSEEKGRLLTDLCVCLAAVVFGMLSLITLTVLIIAVFWESYRWQVLAMLTVMYSIIAVSCALKARARFRAAPPFFTATRAELEKDYKRLIESRECKPTS